MIPVPEAHGQIHLPGMRLAIGSDLDLRFYYEIPLQPMQAGPFFLDSTEVTQRDFSDLMGYNPSSRTGCPACPVDSVSWYHAILYCNARSKARNLDTAYSYSRIVDTTYVSNPGSAVIRTLHLADLAFDSTRNGFRLPGQAEWLLAAQAGSNDGYIWKRLDKVLGSLSTTWFGNNSGGTARPVAALMPNPFGLYDMGGNVAEFTNDWAGDIADIRDPGDRTSVASLGAHYLSGIGSLGIAERLTVPPMERAAHRGFRTARRGGPDLGRAFPARRLADLFFHPDSFPGRKEFRPFYEYNRRRFRNGSLVSSKEFLSDGDLNQLILDTDGSFELVPCKCSMSHRVRLKGRFEHTGTFLSLIPEEGFLYAPAFGDSTRLEGDSLGVHRRDYVFVKDPAILNLYDTATLELRREFE